MAEMTEGFIRKIFRSLNGEQILQIVLHPWRFLTVHPTSVSVPD